MKVRIVRVVLVTLFLTLFTMRRGQCQTFQNLDFESANVPDVASNQVGAPVSAALGMPGWSVSGSIELGTNEVGHNSLTTGQPYVAIEGPMWFPQGILQGLFTADITGSQSGAPASAWIAQTGQIPSDAASIQFYTEQNSFDTFQVTFGGHVIPVEQLGSGPNYYIMGGDISAYAGQTDELRFTALPGTGGLLDNIMFSPSPVPEPGMMVWMVLGGIFPILRLRRKFDR